MGRRGVALNTSIIKIGDMSAYNNTNQINIYNSMSVSGNVSIANNVNIMGEDDVITNENVTYGTETYVFDQIIDNKITVNNNDFSNLKLFIGNTYIFDQTNNTLPTELIIISKKKLQYDRSTGIIERVPYETGVSYSEDNITYKTNTTDYITGCCLFISKKNFIKLNGFDEKFNMYGEDVDLSIRAQNLGMDCYYISNAKLWHYVSASYGGNFSLTKFFLKINSLLKLIFKYPKRIILGMR